MLRVWPQAGHRLPSCSPSSLPVQSLSVVSTLPPEGSYCALSLLGLLYLWLVGIYSLMSKLFQQSPYWLLPPFLFNSPQLLQSILQIDVNYFSISTSLAIFSLLSTAFNVFHKLTVNYVGSLSS